MKLKTAILSAAMLPLFATMASAHPELSLGGLVPAPATHVHTLAGHAVALGTVGILVAALIAAIVMTGSATTPLRKSH
uniref:hypothetical protein n=1 Tax=Pararhizobium sp. IMCC3301 TaxID=3067904 RepID=UPI002740BCA8|nr:hypothetical protein [Pararhizobium sp. IMCC3301]